MRCEDDSGDKSEGVEKSEPKDKRVQEVEEDLWVTSPSIGPRDSGAPAICAMFPARRMVGIGATHLAVFVDMHLFTRGLDENLTVVSDGRADKVGLGEKQYRYKQAEHRQCHPDPFSRSPVVAEQSLGHAGRNGEGHEGKDATEAPVGS